MKIAFTLNGSATELAIDPATPLLWALRDHLNLTGTKYGCGIAACGACTVVVDGQARRSCVTPLEAVSGLKVTTIEGLGGAQLHALQQAWIDHQVPQCGYCQSGMLMAAVGLLNETPKPTDAQIDAAIDNICRCGTYPRVRVAIHAAALIAAPATALKPGQSAGPTTVVPTTAAPTTAAPTTAAPTTTPAEPRSLGSPAVPHPSVSPVAPQTLAAPAAARPA